MSRVKKINFLIYCIFTFLAFSCDIVPNHETIPTYFHIDKFLLSTNSEQGSNSTNITDAWVSIDGFPEEVYPLPKTFPELETGKHIITIDPGIKENGIDASRSIYPFYSSYVIDTVLIAQKIIQINPKITYRPAAKFQFIEDFEGASYVFVKAKSSDTIIERIPDPDTVNHNNKVGAIYLDDARTTFECNTDSFAPPMNGTPVFLEMSYQNNIEFNVGLYALATDQVVDIPVITIFPHFLSRNKIYIKLTYNINSSSTDATLFKIYIRATNPGGISSPTIYLDDIKLLHF